MFAFSLAACASGCINSPEIDVYRDLALGMTPQQAAATLSSPAATVLVNQSEEQLRVMIATARVGTDHAIVSIILEYDRARFIDAQYHFLPHAARPATAAVCETSFRPIQPTFTTLYGSPEVEAFDDGRFRRTTLNWHPHGVTISAFQLIDGNQCGVVAWSEFEGSEVEFREFVARYSPSRR